MGLYPKKEISCDFPEIKALRFLSLDMIHRIVRQSRGSLKCDKDVEI